MMRDDIMEKLYIYYARNVLLETGRFCFLVYFLMTFNNMWNVGQTLIFCRRTHTELFL